MITFAQQFIGRQGRMILRQGRQPYIQIDGEWIPVCDSPFRFKNGEIAKVVGAKFHNTLIVKKVS
ncbi:MAG: hypothetical protein AAFP89_23020 [Bacteroidota bacterium]